MMLGNLDIKRIEERLGVEFPDELIKIMSACRQENVSVKIEDGKWHCFDIPFTIVCGGMEIAKTIHKHLLPLSNDMVTQVRIDIEAAP